MDDSDGPSCFGTKQGGALHDTNKLKDRLRDKRYEENRPLA